MDEIPTARKIIVVVIALAVGLLHFLTGSNYSGPFPGFVNGYLIDILLPFSMYLVLGVTRHAIMRGRIFRGVLVFGIGAITETLQFFGVPIFGQTFDVLDYFMFLSGVGLAIVIEELALARVSPEK
ncbi:MAG: hypothetical protein OEW00_11635 [candidate division Zixibacteria bacterium]|nr:hypothetical protein [candidate division Zixibacteria bacterium]